MIFFNPAKHFRYLFLNAEHRENVSIYVRRKQNRLVFCSIYQRHLAQPHKKESRNTGLIASGSFIANRAGHPGLIKQP